MSILDILTGGQTPKTSAMGIGKTPLTMLMEKTGTVPTPAGLAIDKLGTPAMATGTPATQALEKVQDYAKGFAPETPAQTTAPLMSLFGALGEKGLDTLRPGLAAPLTGALGALSEGGLPTPAQAPMEAAAETPDALAEAAAETPDALAEAAKAEEAKDQSLGGLGDWLKDDANRRLLLGMGAALSQGKEVGEAIAIGMQMKDQFTAGQAGAKAAGAKAQADATLKDAQAKKALAEATKIAKETGAKGDDLKGFRNTFKTIIGEAGGLADPMAIANAQAQAAKQELANKPDSEALKKLLDSSIESILMNIDSMDTEEAQEALTNAKNHFGADTVDAIARKIVGG